MPSVAEIQEFVRAVADRTPIGPDPTTAAEVMNVVDAALNPYRVKAIRSSPHPWKRNK